jgi:hypothetical protein
VRPCFNLQEFNGSSGVLVGQGAGWAILGNSIYANAGRGIRLFVDSNDTQTVNDPGDADTGPNGLENYPVITSAGTGAANTTIAGTLNSTPNTQFRIEFFANDVADPSGFGEGQTFLGFTNVMTDVAGDASFNVAFAMAGGSVISATATDSAGNTSEFSQDFTATSPDVIIDANTTQDFLDSLTVIHGSLIMIGVAGRTDLLLPNLTEVDGDFIVTGNPDLTVIDAPLLTTVGGDLDISDNPALIEINLNGLTSVGGNQNISGDTACTDIDLSNLTSVGGNQNISGDTACTDIDLSNLTSVGGNQNISGDTACTDIDLSGLTSVGGNQNISGDTAVTDIDLSGLISVGGDLDVSDNPSAVTITFGSVTTVGGDLNFSANTSATDVNLGSVKSVGGDLNVSGDTSATLIDLTGLTSVSGDLNISGDTSATLIDLTGLTSVSGDLNVSGDTSATLIDLTGLSSVGGDMTVEAMNSIIAVTADGSTEVTLLSATANMTASLATGTFANPVAFTVTRVDPAALPPEPGLDFSGSSATIDPLAAYQFDFAIPTLGQEASLTFEINVAALAEADRDAFLTALAAGNATVAVKNDALGSVFQAFAICAPGETPEANQCVTLTRLDAAGNPLAPGSTDTPATIRFEGVTGHFSTFAVVIVSASSNLPAITVDVVNGQLIIEGTDDDDIVSITGIPPGVHGSGMYEITTQRGAQPPQTQIVTGVTSDILINLHAGNDQLTMNNAYVNGAIDIQMESGNDAVTLGNADAVSTRTELRVDLGTDNDTLNGRRIYIGTNQIINGGDGNDQLTFDGSASPFTLGTSASGNATWTGGNGNDAVHVIYAFIAGTYTIDLGAGADALDIFGSAASGNVSFFGGAGSDALAVDTNFFDSDMLLDGGADNDSVRLANGLGTELATINAGDGSDSVMLRNQTAARLIIDTGSGDDNVDVRASAFDRFFAQLGDDGDRITVHGNLSRFETELDGGAGTDLLLDLGNDFRGSYRKRNFEFFN